MDIDELAKIIWDYHHMYHKVEKADCIVVLGSHDTRVAVRGAELFLNGFAPVIVFSGGLGRLTLGLWEKPEARVFSEIAIKAGVPEDKILIEDRSTNTGENVLFARKLLGSKFIFPASAIAVQKPYMERRTFATFGKQWPELKVMVTSPQLSFGEYCDACPDTGISKDEIIGIMVGDLQRIALYAQKGYQIYQEIPDYVWFAYEQLVKLGYTGHLTAEG